MRFDFMQTLGMILMETLRFAKIIPSYSETKLQELARYLCTLHVKQTHLTKLKEII